MRIVLDLQGCQTESRFRGIGRYSLALAKAMVVEGSEHEFIIALNGLFPETVESIRSEFQDLVPQDRIRTYSLPAAIAEFDPGTAWRARAAELIRERFLSTLRPDVVHLHSLFEGYVDDAATSIGAIASDHATAVTLYDLIPLLKPDHHFVAPHHRAWYERKLASLRRADLLLAISESAREEALAHLDVPPERVVAIGGAVDERFRPANLPPDGAAACMARFALARPFVLYTGAFDGRKNVEGLLRAYALLPQALRDTHQLALVGKIDEGERGNLVRVAETAGLHAEEYTFTGYISDDDLRFLYSLCDVCVVPSLHEGFGLPALEAMACGAPVVSSDRTSLPEVIGLADALFDPERTDHMAEKIAAVLMSPAFRERLIRHGTERAKTFSWSGSARRALDAISALPRSQQRREVPVISPSRRPSLAYVSPLPPERSGVADYSLNLLPGLAPHYDITLIAEQPEAVVPELRRDFTVRSVRWFNDNAPSFDRLLYHFGNSPFHRHMFELLERHPGAVVLHDFFLSSALQWMERYGNRENAFRKALYDSHGYHALLEYAARGCDEATRTFPANAPVLRHALGVIVHSEHAAELARRWYGDHWPAEWFIAPMVRRAHQKDRTAGRLALGIPESAVLVCAFGFLDPTKLNHQLLTAWAHSTLADDPDCRLIFVGENHAGDYGRAILTTVRGSRWNGRIAITGFTPPDVYRAYLSAADFTVQLRAESRGESSGAVLDCLAYGLPVIVNAHGSNAEFPPGTTVMLPDRFTDQELAAALEELRHDPELREHLSQAGRSYVLGCHSPEAGGRRYRDAIERIYRDGSRAGYKRLLTAIAAVRASPAPSERDLVATAVSIARNQRPSALRQLFIDVSEVAGNDLGTGIQRVTRALIRALIASPPAHFRVEPVYRSSHDFRYARRFVSKNLAVGAPVAEDAVVETSPSDVYLSAEWSPYGVQEMKQHLIEMRARGVKIHFLVFDLLPLQFPHYFPDFIAPLAQQWVDDVAEIADGVICISQSVATQFRDWLREHPPRRQRPIDVGHFRLGADIESTQPTLGLPSDAARALDALAARPTFLMVGTVEPRKGYAQALDAFDSLWSAGHDVTLAIVGKAGWNVEPLVARLRTHPERGQRLFWLESASDEMLLRVYEASTVLLATSEGEGFGLPLVEAARHDLPIIARDIPVFHEVAGAHAYYFRGTRPEALASACQTWLRLNAEGRAPQSSGIRWLTWAESAQELVTCLLEQRA